MDDRGRVAMSCIGHGNIGDYTTGGDFRETQSVGATTPDDQNCGCGQVTGTARRDSGTNDKTVDYLRGGKCLFKNGTGIVGGSMTTKGTLV